MIRRVYFGVPNWIVEHFGSEQRRAFGFWTFVLSGIGAIFFGREVLYVTLISVVALIPNFTSETPVEVEGQPTDPV